MVGRVRQDHITENRRFRGRTVERGSPFDGRARIGKRDFLTHASGLPSDAAIVGDIHADAGARREGAENTVHINGVDSAEIDVVWPTIICEDTEEERTSK